MIKFNADKVLLSGPKIDGSYKVSFEVGEYQLKYIKDLIEIRDCIMEVTVEKNDGNLS